MDDMNIYQFAQISHKETKEITQLEQQIKQDTNREIILVAYELKKQ